MVRIIPSDSLVSQVHNYHIIPLIKVVELKNGKPFKVYHQAMERWTYYIVAPGLQRGFEQNPTTPQSQNPVITVPLSASQLKGLIQDRLNYRDKPNGESCADYVNRLISQASKMAPANNPANAFKDIPNLFDQIVAQPQGGFRFEAATGTRIGTGSGSANGYLVQGNMTITVTPVRYYANNPSYVIRSAVANAPYRYGITGLHEVIHHEPVSRVVEIM